MIIHKLTQGTPEWHEHRAKYFNASDAPAMLGCSPYKTRAELLHEKHTGLAPEVDAHTQQRFDNGHQFESLARPLAEEMIGDDLYPVVGTMDNLSASFDGITMDHSVIFEHKTFNASMLNIESSNDIPEHYRVQMEQQLYISGAHFCLFMATKWSGEECTAQFDIRYESDSELRQRILQGWQQFAEDLANYTPPEYTPEAAATPTKDLPAVSIQINGAISLISNLDAFGARLNEFVENINQKPETDQEFADAEAAIKTLDKAEKALEAAMQSGLAQTASVDEMCRTVKLHKETARTTRLMLEKLVKAQKDTIRTNEIQRGKDTLQAYIFTLNKRLGRPYMPAIHGNFAEAIKGKKTIASVKESINNELTNCKISASQIADKIEINLNTMRELAKDHAHLFHDEAALIGKNNDDLIAVIKSRITEYEAAEAKKAEELRERIRKEEEAKAQAKIEAEAKTKADEEAKQARIAADLERAKQFNQQPAAVKPETKKGEPNETQPVEQKNAEPEQNQQAVAATEAREIIRTPADLVLLIQTCWSFSERDAQELIVETYSWLLNAQKAA